MTLSRRRFLSLLSVSCLVGTAAHAHQWRGTVLGAGAQIIIDHPDAEAITSRALAEINRLENVFSLYLDNTELVRLNTHSRLEAPSFELLECLSIARQVYQLTDGRFDPTVQALWRAIAEAYSAGKALDQSKLEMAKQAIGFERVKFDSGAVELSVGQQLTLNGIAQGYIADRVVLLLQAEGVTDTLINTGEIVALGEAKNQEGWPVTIAGETASRSLRNRALCTSSPLGTVLDSAGNTSHIIDPRDGSTLQTNIRQVSISATRAAMADALSTGLCIVQTVEEAEKIMRRIKDARLESIQTRSHTI